VGSLECREFYASFRREFAPLSTRTEIVALEEDGVTGTERILTAGFLAMAAVIGANCPADAQGLRVTLQLRNDAKLPDDMVAEAEAAVTGIYAKSGVDVTWSFMPAAAIVVLIPRAAAEKMDQAPATMGFALGTETERGHVAYVLEPRVNEVANRYSVPKVVVLGAVIAHEVGHLLLPFNAHSRTGIMRAVWDQTDFLKAAHGHLLFTPQQSAQIRSRMVERQQVAAR
jgi:hypothetical protein